MPLAFSKDEASERGRDLMRLVDGDINNRMALINRRNYIREIYFGHQERYVAYKGESNIHLNVITEKVENTVPKVMNALWQSDPIVHVQRVEQENNKDLTVLNQKFLNWAIDVDIPNFYTVTEQWFRNMLIDGTCIVKTWWRHDERNTVVVEKLKRVIDAGKPDISGQVVSTPRIKTPEELLMEQFGGTLPVRSLESVEAIDSPAPSDPVDDVAGSAYFVSFVEDRMLYEDVRVDFVASRYIDEIELHVHRPITTCDRPEVEIKEFEDIILPYRTEDLQDAPRLAEQYWLTIDEVKQKIDEDGWDINEEELASLQGASQTEDRHEQHPENKQLARQKDRQVGEQSGGRRAVGEAAYVDDKVLIYEVYCRDDVDGDGMAEEVIYHIPRRLQKIVKGYYLEELFPHGRRPYAALHYIRISDRFYSLGMGELLAPINVEVNAIINMVNEAQELINHPFFFYVPSANTVDPKVLEGIKAGQGIPVADTQGVFFPQWSQEPLANLGTMDSMLMYADRLTISPQSAGSSQVRNAPRTARGTMALLSEGGIKTDMVITAAQRGGWRELLHQIHALYSHYGSDEKWFNTVGETKAEKITSADLRGRFIYRFSGNTVNTNKEVMRTIAQTRWSLFAGDPQFLQDPAARLALMRSTLEHFDEGIDLDHVLPKGPDANMSHAPMSQKQEVEIMKQGVWIEPLAIDDHAQHIAELDRIAQTPAFEQYEQSVIANLAHHKRMHSQMLVQQQQQGALPGGNAGQANNTAIPTDLGNLEGGVQ